MKKEKKTEKKKEKKKSGKAKNNGIFQRIQLKKSILVIAIIAVTAFIVYLCSGYVRAIANEVSGDSNPVVTMEIEGYGTVKMELYPDMAPNTVKNFIALINSGYYNGKTISEIGETAIFGGFDLTADEEEETDTDDTDSEETDEDTTETEETDEDTTDTESEDEEEEEYIEGPKLSDIRTLEEGEEDSSYAIEGEFTEAGFTQNTLSHQRGVLSMARESYLDYQYELTLLQYMGYSSYISSFISLMDDSAGSGFFIMTETDTSYNGEYAAFGKVIEGMDVIDSISEVELEVTEDEDGEETTTTTPVEEIVITSMTVDTKGVEYSAPETTSKIDFESIFSSLLSSYSS